jgi:hypothetical protein
VPLWAFFCSQRWALWYLRAIKGGTASLMKTRQFRIPRPIILRKHLHSCHQRSQVQGGNSHQGVRGSNPLNFRSRGPLRFFDLLLEGTVSQRTGTAFGDFMLRMRTLLPYVWPSGHRGLQFRVFLSFLLLLAGRAVNLLVPIQYVLPSQADSMAWL